MNLLPTPGAGFEQPFEMLHACHERVERMLSLLERLCTHVDAHGADEQAGQASRDVMRYFDVAAPQHHLDEERHVFPALLAGADPKLHDAARHLQHDHAVMETQWQALRAWLQAITDGEPLPAPQVLHDFAALYRTHLALEEALAFPAARERLDNAATARMSEDMMCRRGVRAAADR